MRVNEALGHLEIYGKKRAQVSHKIVMSGVDVNDTFTHDGMAIYNPWEDDSGRFEVDPYKHYGREFILWLLRPFYDGTLDQYLENK